jgi:hypothetical protein
MLRSLKDLARYAVHATDGDIGTVASFLLDDERWAVRYLVVETGTFFDARLVLISPISFRTVDWATQTFHVALHREEVRSSPGVDANQPVSRHHEEAYSRYYGYPHYWGSAGLWGMGYDPGILAQLPKSSVSAERSDPTFRDIHLRSETALRGYHIEGNDARIGSVTGFIVDDATWAVRYVVVDTGDWWWGQRVLIAPEWATRIAFDEHKFYVDMTRDAIKNSPAWDGTGAVGREYEKQLHDYHGRVGYWSAEAATKSVPPSSLSSRAHPN